MRGREGRPTNFQRLRQDAEVISGGLRLQTHVDAVLTFFPFHHLVMLLSTRTGTSTCIPSQCALMGLCSALPDAPGLTCAHISHEHTVAVAHQASLARFAHTVSFCVSFDHKRLVKQNLRALYEYCKIESMSEASGVSSLVDVTITRQDNTPRQHKRD